MLASHEEVHAIVFFGGGSFGSNADDKVTQKDEITKIRNSEFILLANVHGHLSYTEGEVSILF